MVPAVKEEGEEREREAREGTVSKGERKEMQQQQQQQQQQQRQSERESRECFLVCRVGAARLLGGTHQVLSAPRDFSSAARHLEHEFLPILEGLFFPRGRAGANTIVF